MYESVRVCVCACMCWGFVKGAYGLSSLSIWGSFAKSREIYGTSPSVSHLSHIMTLECSVCCGVCCSVFAVYIAVCVAQTHRGNDVALVVPD